MQKLLSLMDHSLIMLRRNTLEVSNPINPSVASKVYYQLGQIREVSAAIFHHSKMVASLITAREELEV